MEQNTKQPLVSIVVITYNSSKYILETLESAKNQTYFNLELIISDDCSKDDTVAVCRKWIAENKDRFVRTELITVDKNSGISPNCNRGFRATNGKWIKAIAGDDLLTENCVADNIHYVTTVNPEAQIVFSEIETIDTDSKGVGHLSLSSFFDLKTVREQYEYLLSDFCGSTTSMFLAKELYLKVGGYDEQFLFVEDYPFVLSVCLNGSYCYSFNKTTVKYRIDSGVSKTNDLKVNYLFQKSSYDFLKQKLFKERNMSYAFLNWHQTMIFYKCFILHKLAIRKKGSVYYMISALFVILNPYNLLLRFNRR